MTTESSNLVGESGHGTGFLNVLKFARGAGGEP